jgi:acetylglutamate kinase
VTPRKPNLVKVSGSDLDDATFSRRLAEWLVAENATGRPAALVHGGGKEITELLGALKLESRFVDGLRVTDAPTRDVALMVLAGLANKRMVAHVINAGGAAIGLSGVDGALIRVHALNPALGFVGKPVAVDAELLTLLFAHGHVPIINPMSIGDDGAIYNVNADHAAGALAAALDAELLTFVTNVPGVLDANKQLLPTLTAIDVEKLIESGVINGGMIPKVRTCLEAVVSGVKRVRITNLDGLLAHGGTVFSSVERHG